MSTTTTAAESGTTENFETAVDAGFCAIRDEGAEVDVEFIGIDDGEPNYSTDYEPQMICARRAIIATGLDVDVEEAAWAAVEQYNELSSELNSGAFHGEMHKPDYRAAHSAFHRPNPFQRPARSLTVIPPNIVDTSIIWRTSGRAPRLASNTRTRGSRRGSASRGDPDDLGDKPPADSRLQIGGRR